jgi:hypothetical protein
VKSGAQGGNGGRNGPGDRGGEAPLLVGRTAARLDGERGRVIHDARGQDDAAACGHAHAVAVVHELPRAGLDEVLRPVGQALEGLDLRPGVAVGGVIGADRRVRAPARRAFVLADCPWHGDARHRGDTDLEGNSVVKVEVIT